MTLTNEDAIVRWLIARGARTIAHPGGTLLSHLQRTASRLASWGAVEPLVAAGLCHAAYGTDGFPVSLFDVAQRPELAAIIGSDAEAIVYAYGSVDRAHGLPGIDTPDGTTLRDRFTGRIQEPSKDVLRQLIDLSCANELDLFLYGPETTRRAIADWLKRCGRSASPAADAALMLHLRT